MLILSESEDLLRFVVPKNNRIPVIYDGLLFAKLDFSWNFGSTLTVFFLFDIIVDAVIVAKDADFILIDLQHGTVLESWQNLVVLKLDSFPGGLGLKQVNHLHRVESSPHGHAAENEDFLRTKTAA